LSAWRTPVAHADDALSFPARPATSQFGIASSYGDQQQLTQQPRFVPPLPETLTFDGAMDGQAIPTEPMPRQETGPWHPLIAAQAYSVAPLLPSRTQYRETRSEVESGYSGRAPSASYLDSRNSQAASGTGPFGHGASPLMPDVQCLDIQRELFSGPSPNHPGSTRTRSQRQRTGRRLRSSTASSQWTCRICGETLGLRSRLRYVPRLVTSEPGDRTSGKMILT
jgi:hypothetical protein